MRKLYLFIFLMITTISFAQVSTTRINDFRLGEKKSDLERLMGKSINVNFNEYGYMENPVNVVYKGVVYELFFSSSYDDNGNELNDFFYFK